MEIQFQQKAWMWGCNEFGLYGLLFHVPNETARVGGESQGQHMKRIMDLKAIGLTPGVPDLVLIWKGKVHGFELKDGAKGRVSDAQKKIAAKWLENGVEIHLVRDLEAFKKMLIKIIGESK